MKVLLLEDVPKLGPAGTVVAVADGYARNYLLPRKLAKPITAGSLHEIEHVRELSARRRARQLAAAQEMAQRIESVTLRFQARAGDTGKLYGSITPADIATALSQTLGHEIDRRKIECDPLRQLGEHVVTIRLSADVSAQVRVVIEPASTPAEASS